MKTALYTNPMLFSQSLLLPLSCNLSYMILEPINTVT